MPTEPETQKPVEGVDTWLRPFFEDSSLWPVAIVVALCLFTMGAGVLLLVWMTANPFALLAIVLLAGMTVDIAVRALRRGTKKVLAWCAISLWLGSLAVAALGVALGVALGL